MTKRKRGTETERAAEPVSGSPITALEVIVRGALDEYGLDIPGYLDIKLIALEIHFLRLGADLDLASNAILERERNERAKRIATIETLLGEYVDEATLYHRNETVDVSTAGLRFGHFNDAYEIRIRSLNRVPTYQKLKEHGERDLIRLLDDLKELLEVEKALLASCPVPKPPQRNRPVSIKNRCAERIFNELLRARASRWHATEVISKILVRAKIEKGPVSKVRTALWDRFRQVR